MWFLQKIISMKNGPQQTNMNSPKKSHPLFLPWSENIWSCVWGCWNQLMVNCWFGARWFGFLESPYERDWDSWVYPDSNPKPPGRWSPEMKHLNDGGWKMIPSLSLDFSNDFFLGAKKLWQKRRIIETKPTKVPYNFIISKLKFQNNPVFESICPWHLQEFTIFPVASISNFRLRRWKMVGNDLQQPCRPYLSRRCGFNFWNAETERWMYMIAETVKFVGCLDFWWSWILYFACLYGDWEDAG